MDDNGEDMRIMKTRRFWCARLPEGYRQLIHISNEHKIAIVILNSIDEVGQQLHFFKDIAGLRA